MRDVLMSLAIALALGLGVLPFLTKSNALPIEKKLIRYEDDTCILHQLDDSLFHISTTLYSGFGVKESEKDGVLVVKSLHIHEDMRVYYGLKSKSVYVTPIYYKY